VRALSLATVVSGFLCFSAWAQTNPITLVPAGDTTAGVTFASDGNLWFTSDFENAVIRVTSSGAATRFLTGFSAPSDSIFGGITEGPDGALWFTKPSSGPAGSGAIGRITWMAVV